MNAVGEEAPPRLLPHCSRVASYSRPRGPPRPPPTGYADGRGARANSLELLQGENPFSIGQLLKAPLTVSAAFRVPRFGKPVELLVGDRAVEQGTVRAVSGHLEARAL